VGAAWTPPSMGPMLPMGPMLLLLYRNNVTQGQKVSFCVVASPILDVAAGRAIQACQINASRYRLVTPGPGCGRGS
jgi:hypothetical protein